MKVGEMRERLKRLPWKGSVSERVPRVRIPLSPPVKTHEFIWVFCFFVEVAEGGD